MASEEMAEKINFVIAPALNNVANIFTAAVNAFNTQDGVALGNCLDQNAILFRKRDGAVIAQGHDPVLAALESLFIDHGSGPASFAPLAIAPRPPAWPLIIQGAARWHDNDGSPDDTIPYEFVFNPGNSLILSLWAGHH
jgi:hypothetical protein